MEASRVRMLSTAELVKEVTSTLLPSATSACERTGASLPHLSTQSDSDGVRVYLTGARPYLPHTMHAQNAGVVGMSTIAREPAGRDTCAGDSEPPHSQAERV